MYAELITQCEVASKTLKQLAHPERLMVLCHLSKAEKNVRELEDLCKISQSQLSQFLTRMKNEGLLESRKDGKFSYYRIQDLKVKKLIQAMSKIFCP